MMVVCLVKEKAQWMGGMVVCPQRYVYILTLGLWPYLRKKVADAIKLRLLRWEFFMIVWEGSKSNAKFLYKRQWGKEKASWRKSWQLRSGGLQSRKSGWMNWWRNFLHRACMGPKVSILDFRFWLPELRGDKWLLFLVSWFWVIHYSSHRKLIEGQNNPRSPTVAVITPLWWPWTLVSLCGKMMPRT